MPIYLHADDRQWVMRPDRAIVFWEGETRTLADGLTLVRCGGHFEGGTVLHWADGANGRGALLTGDIIQVVPDRKNVSFMYSYPNYRRGGPPCEVLGRGIDCQSQFPAVILFLSGTT